MRWSLLRYGDTNDNVNGLATTRAATARILANTGKLTLDGDAGDAPI
jgi:hypothetical protein